ncbi:hypothetical protein NC653_026469 [Populus alba x Populus x berolinensis]|uniref:Uncharacterized protein n=1 Tax=Populus alba x Populus x berolinensis TaxID=444605 RepID=A0AAD6QAB3_9ROSI|nr:hypothetical protein NC653_026469 [Populus alba x Populus x berolinensis]
MPCPPTGYKNLNFVIGRTMFETDRVNAEHVKRCCRMDCVWVPTDFHVSTFVKRNLVIGSRKKDSDSKTECVFEWEYRKGWDALLKAYLKEFSRIHGIAPIYVIDTHIA